MILQFISKRIVDAENAFGQLMIYVVPFAATMFLVVWAIYSLFPGQPKDFRLGEGLTAATYAGGELLSLYFIGNFIEKGGRDDLVEAASMPRAIPLICRPFLSAWWVLHFLLLAIGFHQYVLILNVSKDPNALERWTISTIVLVMYFGISFSCNVYLLLAASAIIRQPAILRFIYRSRFMIDVISAAIFWKFGNCAT